MPGLLISVRSVEEARIAWTAGASVVDVKEPERGPLGRADDATVRAIRAVLPAEAPLSVALGELADVEPLEPPASPLWLGIRWRKLGLAGLGADPRWPGRWLGLVDRWGPGPGWIAVIYADADEAASPAADAIVDQAIEARCAGLLVDTWRKDRPSPLCADRVWKSRVERARSAGLTVALAGRLDERAIVRLAPLEPDLFAVRGAVCRDGARTQAIDLERARSLVETVARLSPGSHQGRTTPVADRPASSLA